MISSFLNDFQQVESYDIDANLNEIVNFNFDKLITTNVTRHTLRAEDFDLTRPGKNDLIYIDPDRRDDLGSRQFNIKEHSPDITQLLNNEKIKCGILIKLFSNDRY